jgi:hypothetical protein
MIIDNISVVVGADRFEGEFDLFLFPAVPAPGPRVLGGDRLGFRVPVAGVARMFALAAALVTSSSAIVSDCSNSGYSTSGSRPLRKDEDQLLVNVKKITGITATSILYALKLRNHKSTHTHTHTHTHTQTNKITQNENRMNQSRQTHLGLRKWCTVCSTRSTHRTSVRVFTVSQ